MKSLSGLTFGDIAFEVCSAFHRANISAVLVGGGAAAFYAPEAYETSDLDFVLHRELFGMPRASIIEELGFTPTSASGTYKHPEIPYTLEVLRGPLGIGAEILTTYETLNRQDLVLHVISPTDSVKDRLAHAIHFKDVNAARQAAEVAKVQDVDTEAIRNWCQVEGGIRAFETFQTFLER